MTEGEKLEIFNAILSLGDIWGVMDKVEVLDSIWKLNLMASEDPRYKDAYGDAIKHLRDNDDWDDQYVFLTRFGLLKGDESLFFKFLEVVVSPEVRGSEDEIIRYVEKINSYLQSEKISLSRNGARNGLPVFEISAQIADETRPTDIARNQFPFYVDEEPGGYPSFYLDSCGWDDFGRKTKFRLSYCKSSDKTISIGYVKIMNDEDFITWKVLPSSFHELNRHFCSVGQDECYYDSIKKHFPDTYREILFALKDAAYFTKIADRFQYTISFEKSLLRDSSALSAFRNAHCILDGIQVQDRYKFTVKARIPYFEEESVDVNFDFGDLDDLYNIDRVKALIGENGSGKSSVLFSLAKALNEDRKDMFEDEHKPDFTKVIAISYSIYDNFYKLTKNSSFNFIYCGLRDNKDNNLISQDEIKNRFALSLGNIEYKNRVYEYTNTLKEVVDEALLDGIVKGNGKFDLGHFEEVRNKMSTGQAMIVSIVTELYAHIRENSLILFDEPEVHLHSNAITKLLDIVFIICARFKSACILATHSSVVLQELLARNVTVIERCAESNEPLVRPMNTETLGENLTTITEDVFGRANISKHYRKLVNRLVRENWTEEKIESFLKSDGLPMSLNLYLYIRRVMERKVEND